MSSIIERPTKSQLVITYGKPYGNAIHQYFKRCGKLDYNTIVKYLKECKGTYSNSTIALYKAALKKYIKKNILDLNQRAILDTAFADIKVPRANHQITDSKIVSKETVLKMIERANQRDGLIIQTLFATGMRVSELINIELRHCKVISANNLKYINILIVGKGNKERNINISLELFENIKNVFNSKVYLFETRRHSKYIRNNIYTLVNKAGCRVLGTAQVHPHTLRHSFATHLLVQEKQSIKAVSSYLGHSSTAITSDFYIHDSVEPEKVINII